MTTKLPPQLIDPTGSTSGQVLTSTGGASAPSFQAISSSAISNTQAGTGAVPQTIAQRFAHEVFVEEYGAKGDGTTDDTTAIQNALNCGAFVRFTAGKTYKTTARISVPTTCLRIDGTGAWMIGPGYTSAVNAFEFTGFYQGAGDIQVKSELYILPSLRNYLCGVYLQNSAFLRIHCDTIRNCTYGYFATCNAAANYCMELELTARMIWHCRNGGNTSGGAFYMQMTGTATSSYQGNRCKAFYVDDCWAAVVQDFSSSGSAGNINNLYEILECDQSTYAVYNTKALSSGNTFRFPMGITSPGNAQMFVNWDGQDSVDILGCKTNDPAFASALNFQWIGVSNRPFIAIQSGGVPTLYVSPSGSDTTGNGSTTAPFATIQKAVNVFAALDLNGGTVYVALRDGTYSAGATLSNSVNGKIAVIGNSTSPANVVVNGTFTADGSGSRLSVSSMLLNGGVVAKNSGAIEVATNMTFGAAGSGVHIQATDVGRVYLMNNYTVTGAASVHLNANLNAMILASGASACTMSGIFTFSGAVAQAFQGGQINVSGITYTGANVAGARYNAGLNAVIYTGGGGANFFPGTVAGSVGSGAQYA